MKRMFFIMAFLMLGVFGYSQTLDTIVITTTTSTGGFQVDEGNYPTKHYHKLTYETHRLNYADSLGFTLYNNFGRKVSNTYPYDRWKIDGATYLSNSALQTKLDSIFVNFKYGGSGGVSPGDGGIYGGSGTLLGDTEVELDNHNLRFKTAGSLILDTGVPLNLGSTGSYLKETISGTVDLYTNSTQNARFDSDGLTLYEGLNFNEASLTGNTTVTMGGNDLNFSGGNLNFTDTLWLNTDAGYIGDLGNYVGFIGGSGHNMRLTLNDNTQHLGINVGHTSISSHYFGVDSNGDALYQIRGDEAAQNTDPTEYARIQMLSNGLGITTYKGNMTFNAFTDINLRDNVAIGDSHTALGKLDVRNGTMFFNLDNEDYDFRFDGTSDNLLRSDAANNRIGLLTGTPSSLLHLNGGVGSLATGLTFGDGDSGMYEVTDDNFVWSLDSLDLQGNLNVQGTIDWDGDATTNGGRVLGQPSDAPIYQGSSYYFDGSSYVAISDSPDLNFGEGDFSINTRFYAESTGAVQTLIRKRLGGNKGYALILNTSGYLALYLDDDVTLINGTVFANIDLTESWNNISVTFDRDGNATAYNNGVELGTIDISAVGDIDYATTTYIGCRDGSADYFNGQISDVQLYNYALSQDRIESMYRGSSTPFSEVGASQTSIITDGTFDTACGVNWTCSNATISGGLATITSGAGYVAQDILKVGATYTATYTISNYTVGDAGISGQTTTNASKYASANGTHTLTFVHDGTTPTRFALVSTAAGVKFDDVTLIHHGEVLSLTENSISETEWLDQSGNALDGTVSGATVVNYKGWHTDGTYLMSDNAFILPNLTSTIASGLTGRNGMMIYVTDTDATFTSVGVWAYENGSWVKL